MFNPMARASVAQVRRPSAAGDAKAANPRNVAGQIGEHMSAIGRVERCPGVGARDDLQQGAHRIGNLALRFGPAARQIDHLGVGEFGAFSAGCFEATHPLEHQRGDCHKRDDDQPGAYAQPRLAAPRRLR